MRTLLLGYGNPGRGDDALGPALAEAASAWGIQGLTARQAFQLNVEDAMDLGSYDAAVFVDASVRGPAPFEWRALGEGGTPSFSSHEASPEGVLALGRRLFGVRTRAYVLAIRGYDFDEFGAPLSAAAAANLAAAQDFLRPLLRAGLPQEAGAAL